MTLVRWITPAAVALLATAGPAFAHVQASANENNRYLKLTPLGDRVRLAYTVYFGEVPGAALRRQLDRDGDGEVGPAEAERLGQELGAEILPRLRLTLDGANLPLRWSEIDVGLGTPAVRAGSFAVDLIATACIPTRGAHELVLQDDYPLPIPGETELKLEAGLGVTVDRVHLGGSLVNGDDVKLRGVGGPLAEGWRIELVIGDAAPTGGADCAAELAVKPAAGPSRLWFAALGAVAAAIAAAVMVVVKRRRR